MRTFDMQTANRRIIKKLDGLLVENVLLYINFFDNDKTVKHNQLCVPQKLQIRLSHTQLENSTTFRNFTTKFQKKFLYSRFQ